MIHPTSIATQPSKTKKEAAKDLIAFWKENDIYVRPFGYLNIFLGIGLFLAIFLTDTPYKIYFQAGIMAVFFNLMIRRYWLEKKANKSDAQHDDAIEHVRLQKEKMIARRASSLKLIYWGFPIIMLLKISSIYFFNTEVSWVETAFLAGILLVVGIAAIIMNRKAFVQPIADADKVLRMEE